MADINEKIDQVGDKLGELNNTADTTAEYDPEDIKNNKFQAILAFVFSLIYYLYILIVNKEPSKFVRFHLNQGLVLWLINIIVNVANRIFTIFIFRIILWVVSFALFVIAIIGIINICNGKAKELPVVGGIKLLK